MNEASERYWGPASRPGVFGEVLFDDFEGGPTVIGGAAFNLAWNLESLGLAPLLLSRVGAAELGGRALERSICIAEGRLEQIGRVMLPQTLIRLAHKLHRSAFELAVKL